MNFELTEEQKQIKASVREFAESEIAPHVMEWDESQHFPVELQPKLADLGLLGVLFPEEYGGAGMGYVEYATIIEELSRVDGSLYRLTVKIRNCTEGAGEMFSLHTIMTVKGGEFISAIDPPPEFAAHRRKNHAASRLS